MVRWMLPAFAAAILSLPAAAAEAPAGPGDLAARIAELETQVKELKALLVADLGLRAAKDLDQERRAKERAEALKRVDALALAVERAGEKAAGSQQLADLLAFSAHADSEVRRYLAASLDRFPGKLVGTALAGMVKDENFEVAADALKSLVVLGEAGGREAAAERMESMSFTGFRIAGFDVFGTPVRESNGSVAFLIAASDYLVRHNDARGIATGMKHLRRFAAREEAETRLSGTSFSMGFTTNRSLETRQLIESLDRWTGAGTILGKTDPRMGGYPSPQQNLAAAKRLLEWWDRNKDGFKLPAAQAQAKPDGARPEQF